MADNLSKGLTSTPVLLRSCPLGCARRLNVLCRSRAGGDYFSLARCQAIPIAHAKDARCQLHHFNS
eukprot:5390096-Amphidinium_carterae.1